MNKIPYIPFAIAFAAAAVLAEEAENVASTETPVPTEERQDAGDSRWHFSIGARFAPGVKTRASMSRKAFSTLSRKMSFAGLESRETRSSTSVEESSSSLTERGTVSAQDGRYEFDAGFIDMNDSAGVAGETWNWHLDSTATFDETTGTFTIPMGSSSSASSDPKRSSGSRSAESSDVSPEGDRVDDGLWGVDAEIGYDFHRSGRWALGAGLGVSFYEDADAFRLAGRCHEARRSKTSAEVSVDTSSEISENAFLTDPYYAGAADELRNADGSYGAGTFDGHSNPYGGGNPVLSVSGIDSEKTTDTATRTTIRTTTATSSLAVDLASEGTVSTWEMRLALQPSYRVTDWCEVRGTFGAVMTHVDVDVDSTVFVNRRMYRQVSSSPPPATRSSGACAGA